VRGIYYIGVWQSDRPPEQNTIALHPNCYQQLGLFDFTMHTLNPQLDNYATCYDRNAIFSSWQHRATGEIFRIYENDDKFHLEIFDRELGRWNDQGVQTINQIVRMTANYAK
jgi:hypothetical protein